MDYFPRKSLSKYLTDMIDFNKHWQVEKICGRRLFKITRRLELRFWPTKKRSQPSQGDFFAWVALQREPWYIRRNFPVLHYYGMVVVAWLTVLSGWPKSIFSCPIALIMAIIDCIVLLYTTGLYCRHSSCE
jgi:hypothetical protein